MTHTVSYFDNKQFKTVTREFEVEKEADDYVASLGSVKLLKRSGLYSVDCDAINDVFEEISVKLISFLEKAERQINSIYQIDINLGCQSMKDARKLYDSIDSHNYNKKSFFLLRKRFLTTDLEYMRRDYFQTKALLEHEKKLQSKNNTSSSFENYKSLEEDIEYHLDEAENGYIDSLEDAKELMDKISPEDKIKYHEDYARINIRFLEINLEHKRHIIESTDMTLNPESYFDMATEEEINRSNFDDMDRDSHLQKERNTWQQTDYES